MGTPGLLSIDVGGTSASVAFKESEKYPYKKIKKRIENYKEVNKEVVGWLTIPGTGINDPIVLSKKNNNYYLKRDWRGTNYPDLNYQNWTQRPATANYLDYRTVFGDTWRKGTSRNLVLYGHNWNNLRESSLVIGNKEGYTMFSQLPSYTNKDFATQNPYIYFSSEKQEGIWKVFAVAYCELNAKFAYNTPNISKEDFKKLINEWDQRSILDFSTEVDETDRILTLSTCTRQYDVGAYQRFTVVARLLREGESEKDKVKVTVKTDYKKPAFK